MKKLIVYIFTLCFSAGAQAQNKGTNWADVAFSFGKTGYTTGISAEKLYPIGKKEKLNIGFGLRLTSYFAKADQLKFRTAPAKLTSGKASLAALFSEDILANIDTLNFSKLQTNSLNLYIDIGLNLSRKISVGFNIDAIGLSFGKNQNATFEANVSDNEGLINNGKTVKAKPTTLNLLLVSDSDIGSLNSEIYARIKINEKTALRAGGCFQFIEYSAERDLAFDNNRFRMKQLMPFLALSIKI